MIYRNEDNSIYKIGNMDDGFMLFQNVGNEKISNEEIQSMAKEISNTEKSINEIIEVLNYLLKKVKIIKHKKEHIELPELNDTEVIKIT